MSIDDAPVSTLESLREHCHDWWSRQTRHIHVKLEAFAIAVCNYRVAILLRGRCSHQSFDSSIHHNEPRFGFGKVLKGRCCQQTHRGGVVKACEKNFAFALLILPRSVDCK